MKRCLFPILFFLLLSGAYGDTNNNPPIGIPCVGPRTVITGLTPPRAVIKPRNSPYSVEEGGSLEIVVDCSIRDGSVTWTYDNDCQTGSYYSYTETLTGSFDDNASVTTAVLRIPFTAPDIRPNGGVVHVPLPELYMMWSTGSGHGPGTTIMSDKEMVTRGMTVPVTILTRGVDPRGSHDSEGWEPNSAFAGGDSDGDGLDDAWELHYFGNLDQGPWDDPDGDNLPNIVEANRGYNPTIKTTLEPLYIKPYTGLKTTAAPQSLAVAIENPNHLGVIRYTLDGTEPVTSSPVYYPGNYIELLPAGDITVRATLFVRDLPVIFQTETFKTVMPKNGPASGMESIRFGDIDVPVPPRPVFQGIIMRPLAPPDEPRDEDGNRLPVTPTYSDIYFPPYYVTSGNWFAWGTENRELMMMYARDPLQGPQGEQEGWLAIYQGQTTASCPVPVHGYDWPYTAGDLYQSSSWTLLTGSGAWYNASVIWADGDEDGDGIPDLIELGVYHTNPRHADTDGDGLPDAYEVLRSYLNPLHAADASEDIDGDGLTNLEEYLAGTDMLVHNLDSDRDGLSDEDEINLYGTDPHNPDTDGDGIPDVYEISVGTDPLVARQELISTDFQTSLRVGWQDTDGDWMPDDYEDRYPGIMDPLVADGDKDGDGDGVSNWQEWAGGHRPDNIDTDGDGMPDGWELQYGLDPTDPRDADLDTDGDGLINRLEYEFDANPLKADTDDDGLSDLQEVLWGTVPRVFDSHQPSHFRSGLSHYWQLQDDGTDTDGDGLSDLAEQAWGTDPQNPDTDGDGMTDGWEAHNKLDPRDPTDAAKDTDRDGLTNLEEYQRGLLPYDFDTDGDGLGDGWEIAQGFDPLSFREGLVAWWRFDSGEANGAFNDSASLRHDGLLTGGAKVTSGGRVKSALQLDGKDACAVIKDHEDLALAGSATVSLWFKPAANSLRQTQQLFDKRGSYTLELVPEAEAGSGAVSGKTARVVFTWWQDGEPQSFAGTGVVTAGRWNHLALILDREQGQLRLLLDGEDAGVLDDAALAAPFEPTEWPLIIGSQRTLPRPRTPNGLLDDMRLYTRVLESAELHALSHPEDPSLEPNRDRDEDGATEKQEYTAGTDPQNADTDGDGLTDGEELNQYSTNPRLVDTDGDGLSDYDEVHVYGTNPRSQDTDGDYLNDYDEIFVHHTDPLKRDSDGDGMPDGWEVYYGFDPLDAADGQADPDGDGIVNVDEYLQGKYPHYADAVPAGTDSDGDGVPDWDETRLYGTNPNNPDTYGDGMGDLYRAAYDLWDWPETIPPQASSGGMEPGFGVGWNGVVKTPGLPASTTDLSIGVSPIGGLDGRMIAAASGSSGSGSAGGDADGDGTSNGNEAGRNSSPRDPADLSAVVLLPIRVTPRPKEVTIAHDAPEPEPIRREGPVAALRYWRGDTVHVDEEVGDGRGNLIAAVDRVYVEDPTGQVEREQIGTGGGLKAGVRSDAHLGEPADTTYNYRSGYNITTFVEKLPVDENGYVRFRIVAEVGVPSKRLPKPGGGGDGDGGENPSNPGTDGPGGNEGGYYGGGPGSGPGGWGPWLAGVLIGGFNGSGTGNPTTPSPYKWEPPPKPTYAATRMTAYIINRADLSVSHAVKPDDYLSEEDEDEIGGIASLAKEDKTAPGVIIVPEVKSKLRLGRGPLGTEQLVLTWDSSKLIIPDPENPQGPALASPKVFAGNEVRFLELYGKENTAARVQVKLEAQRAGGSPITSDAPDTVQVVLAPMTLRVDANRNGRIDDQDDGVATQEKPYRFWLNDDQDTQYSSLFWTDIDPERYPPNRPDSADRIINSPRDCEDLARLWFGLQTLADMLKKEDGELYLGFKWKNTSGTKPALRLFRAADPAGDLGHIKSVSIAREQSSGVSVTAHNFCLLDISAPDIAVAASGVVDTVTPAGASPADFIFKRRDLEKLESNNPWLYLLFEGVEEGIAELTPVIVQKPADGDWRLVAKGDSVWIELINIRKMYMRAHSTPLPDNFPLPFDLSQASNPPYPFIYDENGALQVPEYYLGYALGDSTSDDLSRYPFTPPSDEKPECVVFVHGIDMTVPAQQGYAQSFLKRLWWEGYQGRFVAFRWATTLQDDDMFKFFSLETGANFQIFNGGEYRSWKGGASLCKYMTHLKGELPTNSTVSLVAHSLGNACAAEALRQGMQVDNFVAMEAAVPLSCYFSESQFAPAEERLVTAELEYQKANPATPEYASQGGYHGYLASIKNNVSDNFVCYYNKDDFWLMTGKTSAWAFQSSVDWLTNEVTGKPGDRVGPSEYSVKEEGGPWFEYEGLTEHERPVRDPHEIMAFVSRPRTRALGAVENDSMLPPGVEGVNMNSQFGFERSRIDHSGQFQRNIQYMYEDGKGNSWLDRENREKSFYQTLMEHLDVSSSLVPTP
ncbi:hypothetical protein OPIT5_04865 [Opitutaceae bacterium TAV5]|nr:hypothetical protein OPIT5_04865 [Opitutaceae bacterium TAV5]